MRGQAQRRQFPRRVQRVGHVRPGTRRPQRLHQREHPRVGGLLDPAPVRGAEHQHALPGDPALQCAVQHPDRVARHLQVGRPGRPDHRRRGVVPQVEPRVDRDAVPADRDARPVQMAERLRVAGVGDGGEVHPDPVRVPGELVGQGDVDVPVGGLGELGELRRLGGLQLPDAVRPALRRQLGARVEVQHRPVELGAAPGGGRVGPAHQLGVAAQVGEDPAGADPLRAEDQREVPALGQPGAGRQARRPAAPGDAHRQGGLVADQRAPAQPGRDRVGGGVEQGEVGRAVGGGDQRDDQDDRLGPGDGGGGVGGGAQPALGDHPFERLVQSGLARERRPALVDRLDHRRGDVGAGHPVALGGELDGERQTELAQAHHADVERARRRPPFRPAHRRPPFRPSAATAAASRRQAG